MQSLPPYRASQLSQSWGWLGRVASALVAVGVGVVLFMFSLAVFAVIITLALGAWGYVWWRTRDLRRQMRDSMAHRSTATRGDVIEGDFIRIDRETIETRDP